jgi:hypothetical protein
MGPAVARFLGVLCLGAFIIAGAPPASGQTEGQAGGQAAPTGKVSGRILGLKPGVSGKGAKVVLVRFTLDDKGQPQGNPIQMQDADAGGAYTFENVPIESHSLYQLGTRVDGTMIPSESFTFPEGKRTITLNLRVPEVVTDNSSVRIAQALIALEPQVGSVWVTDVVHLENPTQNVIDGVRTPLELMVPPNAEQLEVIRQDQQQGTHQRVGSKLLVFGNLQPGITTVAYRYRVPVLLGTLNLEKTYPRAVTEMLVLSPAGMLKVSSDRLDARQPRVIEKQSYDVWNGANLAPDGVVRITAAGVPLRQAWLLAPFALFLVIMAGVVMWYVRRRLPAASTTLSA